MVTIGLTAVADAPHAIGELRVAGDDGAAVSERAQIFRRVEAEGAGYAERADWLSRAGGEMRLAAVFDERQAAAGRQGRECRHVGGLPIEMHRHQGFRPRSDGAFSNRRIERETLVI